VFILLRIDFGGEFCTIGEALCGRAWGRISFLHLIRGSGEHGTRAENRLAALAMKYGANALMFGEVINSFH